MPRSAPSLSELQATLRAVFTDPRGARAAAAERPEAARWIIGTPSASAADRLSVYGDAYFLRLLEALAHDYRAVRRCLGEEGFCSLCAEFVAARPSTSPSLSDLGESLPELVAVHRFSKALPFLPDLARLERATATRLLTDRLPAAEPAAFSTLGAQDWPRARLLLDPTVLLLETGWAVDKLWRRRDEPLDGPGRVLRRPEERKLLVDRDDWVRVRAIGGQEWLVLSRLQDRQAIGEALSGVEAAPAEVQRWFSRWVSEGIVKGVLA